MSDEIPTTADNTSNPAVETTESNVSQPLTNSKPYDDDLLEAYEAEATEEVKEESPPVEAKKEESKELAEKPKEEAAPEPAKSKEGDTEIDGIEEVSLKKPINGKTVEFKIKDAVQAYIKQEEFNRNMDKRITHISQREKRWAQEQANFKEKVGKVIEVAQGGDFVSGIRALAKLAAGGSGLDVVEFEKQYFEQLDKVRDVYTKMTPEQREAYFAKRALAEAKDKAKALEEEKAVSTQRNQLQEQVLQVQKQYGLSEDEFWENYKTIEESQVGEGRHFKSPQEIQIEDVVKFSLAVKHEEKVLQAGAKFGIDDDEILDKISLVTSTDPSLTVEDIAKVIETSGLAKNANPEAVENLNRKAEKSKTRFNQASSTKKNGIPEGYDEETLNHLYRNQPRQYQRVNR